MTRVIIDVGNPDWPASDLGLDLTLRMWAIDEAKDLLFSALRDRDREHAMRFSHTIQVEL